MNQVHIFVPVRNRLQLLIETLTSVVLEKKTSKDLQINITVLSNSEDNSKKIVNNLFNDSVEFIELRDRGLYDALGQFLPLIDQGYTSWLGAGDLWMPGASRHINEMINRGANWFMGIPQILDKNGDIKFRYPKRKYYARLIQEGWHDGYLPLIQQESTFWNSELHRMVDWQMFRSLELAGDYFLWKNFSEVEKLISSDNYIAGFRLHDDSLSSNYELYKQEINSFSKRSVVGYIMSKIIRSTLFFQKIIRWIRN